MSAGDMMLSRRAHASGMPRRVRASWAAERAWVVPEADGMRQILQSGPVGDIAQLCHAAIVTPASVSGGRNMALMRLKRSSETAAPYLAATSWVRRCAPSRRQGQVFSLGSVSVEKRNSTCSVLGER